jgi:hypothetical protein
MKKTFLFILLLSVIYQNSIACDCVTQFNTFCQTIESTVGSNFIIARFSVLKHTKNKFNQSVHTLKILNLYNGVEKRQEIQAWGSDGVSCRDNLPVEGKVFIGILGRITDAKWSSEEKVGDYSSFSFCTVSTVLVENGKINGFINNPNLEETIDDIDPTRLFFCPNFKTDKELADEVQIAPNPTDDILIFKNLKQEIFVEIYDVLGRLVIATSISKAKNELQVADLSAGLYIVRVGVNTASNTVKFVKI